MGGLSAAFRCDCGKETMAVYFRYLQDHSIEAVQHGVDSAIKTLDRFPVVAKLRELSGTYRRPDNRKPVLPKFQIEEFTGEREPFDQEKADEFFKQMLGDLSEHVAVE